MGRKRDRGADPTQTSYPETRKERGEGRGQHESRKGFCVRNGMMNMHRPVFKILRLFLSAATTRDPRHAWRGKIPCCCSAHSRRRAAACLLSHLHFSSDLAADGNQRQQQKYLPRLVHHTKAPLRAHVGVPPRNETDRPTASVALSLSRCATRKNSRPPTLRSLMGLTQTQAREMQALATQPRPAFLLLSFQPDGEARPRAPVAYLGWDLPRQQRQSA